tara:strand:- start:1745 stop:3022 length:1278 start_codon:yes stop_codon:yes gene_type:complete
MKNPKETIKELKFCIIDLETTGGNHQYDKIIEIGLVKIKNFKIDKKLSYLIKPNITIPNFIQKLTSITPKDIEDAPLLEQVIDKILHFIGDSILVAHNSSFDIPFLNSELERINYPTLTNKTLCTNLMTKYIIPEILNTNLSYMCQILDIKHGRAHRAIDDATATTNLLIKYLHFFMKKNIKKVNHLYYPRKRYEIETFHITKENQKLHLLEELSVPVLISFKDLKGKLLSLVPFLNTKDHIKYVKSLSEKLNWDLITVKYMKTYLDCILHYLKTPNLIEDKNISDLNLFLKIKNEENILINKDNPSFLITKHLYPYQFTIYPLCSQYRNFKLLFKYPGQLKKFDNFINNYVKKIKTKKNKKIKSEIPSFIRTYLTDQKEKYDVFHFDYHTYLKDDNFQKRLKDFLSHQRENDNFLKDQLQINLN